MADEDLGILNWYYPEERCIIPLDEQFHVPRRLLKTVRQGRYRITYNQAFHRVLHECFISRDDTWINEEYCWLYHGFYKLGIAHSVEAWEVPKGADEESDDARNWRLVGGLYGISLGGVFAGESMFSAARDASKVCLVHLVHRLRHRGFQLLDSQIINDHIEQFGAYEIEQEEYLDRLNALAGHPCSFAGEIPEFNPEDFRN